MNGPTRFASTFLSLPLLFLCTTPALSSASLSAQEPRIAIGTDLVTPELKIAAEEGLRYLAGEQHQDGYWAQDIGYKLNTNYNITKSDSAHIGVTSLALISFMAGGHLPNRGEFGDNIERGLNYILNHIHESGYITDNGS
ncbi:MAG: hypothetical protein ACYTG5_19735, partial [Planctomycetota bacterium]